MIPFQLNDKVTIERRVLARDPEYGTEVESWEPIAARIWANVQDVLPSRAEQTNNGLRTGNQQARLRIRKRDVQLTDRVRLHSRGDKIMQVISGPALLDNRMFIEVMLEGYSHG